MKFVIASSPFAGHLNPLLQIAGLLRGRGQEIIVHTATFLEDRAAGLDARFVPLHGNAAGRHAARAGHSAADR